METETKGVELEQEEGAVNNKPDKNKILNACLYIGVLLIGVVVLTFGFRLVGITGVLLIAYILYMALIGLVFLVCAIEKRKIKDLGFFKRKIHIQILIGVVVAVVMSLLVGALPILLFNYSLVGAKPSSPIAAISSIATDLIFIGTFEELIFRGYIQTRINELTRHKFVGVLIAAALFGLWHIINGNMIQVMFTFVIGAVFGFCRAYLKDCSLLSVIIAHGLYDALLVVIALILL